MNITIYYQDKKIIIQEKNQSSHNQSFKYLDGLNKEKLQYEFELFINQTESEVLVFETLNVTEGLEKFKKAFKFIKAAGGLIEHNHKYLFIFRLKTWDLPKGKLDKGETPEKAAVRECEEECGITHLSIVKTLDPTFHIYAHKGGYALKKTYWYAMTTKHEGLLIPQIEECIEKVEWFDKKQIQEQVINHTYPAILEVIKHTD